jgi:hypothetical protein
MTLKIIIISIQLCVMEIDMDNSISEIYNTIISACQSSRGLLQVLLQFFLKTLANNLRFQAHDSDKGVRRALAATSLPR